MLSYLPAPLQAPPAMSSYLSLFSFPRWHITAKSHAHIPLILGL